MPSQEPVRTAKLQAAFAENQQRLRDTLNASRYNRNEDDRKTANPERYLRRLNAERRSSGTGSIIALGPEAPDGVSTMEREFGLASRYTLAAGALCGAAGLGSLLLHSANLAIALFFICVLLLAVGTLQRQVASDERTQRCAANENLSEAEELYLSWEKRAHAGFSPAGDYATFCVHLQAQHGAICLYLLSCTASAPENGRPALRMRVIEHAEFSSNADSGDVAEATTELEEKAQELEQRSYERFVLRQADKRVLAMKQADAQSTVLAVRRR